MRPKSHIRTLALAGLLVAAPLAPAARAETGGDVGPTTAAGVLYAINCGMSLRLVRFNPVFIATAIANCALMIVDALGEPDP